MLTCRWYDWKEKESSFSLWEDIAKPGDEPGFVCLSAVGVLDLVLSVEIFILD